MVTIRLETLNPICIVLDGTDEECPDHIGTCEYCGDIICATHSDGQFNDGRTDPIQNLDTAEWRHRACWENTTARIHDDG